MKWKSILLICLGIYGNCYSQFDAPRRLPHFDDVLRHDLFDFDSDGDMDAIIYSEESTIPALYELGILEFHSADSSYQYHRLERFSTINMNYIVDDFDADGLFDVLAFIRPGSQDSTELRLIEVGTSFGIESDEKISVFDGNVLGNCLIDYNLNSSPDLYVDLYNETFDLVFVDFTDPNPIQIDTLSNTVELTFNPNIDYFDTDGDAVKDLIWSEMNGLANYTYRMKGISGGGFSGIKENLNINTSAVKYWGDFDGDGDQDIAYSPVSLYENTASAFTFHSGTASVYGTYLMVVDFNNDGLDDIISSSIDQVEVLESNGDFSFTSRAIIDLPSSHSFNKFDLNFFSNSSIELVINGAVLGTTGNLSYAEEVFFVEIDLTTGQPTFKQLNSQTAIINKIKFSDLDNDGDLDYLTTGDVYTHSVCLQNSSGQFIWKSNVPNKNITGQIRAMHNWELADMNGDGLVDIVTSRSGGAIIWIENLGNGTFSDQDVLISDSHNFLCDEGRFIVADLDSDGDMDVVANAHLTGDIYMCWNDGNGNFGSTVLVGNLITSPYFVSGNLNGGTYSEILAQRDGSIKVFEYDGNNWNEIVSTSTGHIFHQMELMDYDSDGDLDLVGGKKQYDGADFTINEIKVLVNNGSLAFNNVDYLVTPTYQMVDYELFDYDDDNDLDILALGKYNFGIFENSGNYTFGTNFDVELTIGYGAYGGAAMTVEDIDNDGDKDPVFSLQGPQSNTYLGFVGNGLIPNNLGIEESALDNNQSIYLFPNPGTDYISIVSNLNEPIDIVIVDLNGKVILEKTHFSVEQQLDVSDIKTGAYIVYISNNNEFTSAIKWIKH